MRYIVNISPHIKYLNISEIISMPDIVYFEGEITQESSVTFRRDLEIAESNALSAQQEILPICIDTRGGCLYSLFGMIDAINSCKITIATVVESTAQSAGVLLFTQGHPNHRYIGPNATLMLHSASGDISGSIEQLNLNTQELNRLYDKYLNLLNKNCSKTKNFFNKKVKENGPEWTIDAKEAKRLGIASHIGIPTLETNIIIQNKLKI